MSIAHESTYVMVPVIAVERGLVAPLWKWVENGWFGVAVFFYFYQIYPGRWIWEPWTLRDPVSLVKIETLLRGQGFAIKIAIWKGGGLENAPTCRENVCLNLISVYASIQAKVSVIIVLYKLVLSAWNKRREYYSV